MCMLLFKQNPLLQYATLHIFILQQLCLFDMAITAKHHRHKDKRQDWAVLNINVLIKVRYIYVYCMNFIKNYTISVHLVLKLVNTLSLKLHLLLVS